MQKNSYILRFLGAFLFICTEMASAVEVRPLFQFDFPSNVTIEKNVKDVKQDKDWSTDPVYIGGAELIFAAEFSPIHYGFGLGYKSAQRKGSMKATPGAVPVWAHLAFGAFNKDRIFSPYAVARFGTLAPLSKDGNWWERPLNFMIEGGVGTYLPYGIGLEVVYDYSSMKKSFQSNDTDFRVSSGRVGIQLSIGFELSRDRTYQSDEEKTEQKNGNTETADNNNPYASYYTELDEQSSAEEYATFESATETPSEPSGTDTGDTPAETGYGETAADNAATEPSDSAAEGVAESAPETPTEPATEESAEPDSATAESVSETADDSATESVAEPAEEEKPAAEEKPASASKKASKKSSKKAAKKTAKKSTKKAAKKTTKKKKK